MPINIRRAVINDLVDMQHMNMMCLPENYTMRYYLYHLLTWPELSFVAHDGKDKIVGYVLGKLDDDDTFENHSSGTKKKIILGHITSLAVKLSYRKLGIAKALMDFVERQMSTLYSATHVTLHVRVGNSGALHLYRKTLKFQVKAVENKYYGDGEDAYIMEKPLNRQFHIDFYQFTLLKAKEIHQKVKEAFMIDHLSKVVF